MIYYFVDKDEILGLLVIEEGQKPQFVYKYEVGSYILEQVLDGITEEISYKDESFDFEGYSQYFINDYRFVEVEDFDEYKDSWR